MSKTKTASSSSSHPPKRGRDDVDDDVDVNVMAVAVAVPDPTSSRQVDMAEYQQTTPLWKRVWRHSLTQMLLLSVQAFCGPAMSDAISGLGGGGLATPETSNIAYVAF